MSDPFEILRAALTLEEIRDFMSEVVRDGTRAKPRQEYAEHTDTLRFLAQEERRLLEQ